MKRISFVLLTLSVIALTLAPLGCGGVTVGAGYYRGYYGPRPWYGYRDRYVVVDRPPCVDCGIDPDRPVAVPLPEPAPDFPEPMPMDIPDIPMDMPMDF